MSQDITCIHRLDVENVQRRTGDETYNIGGDCKVETTQKIKTLVTCDINVSSRALTEKIQDIQNNSDSAFAPLTVSAAITNVDDVINEFNTQVVECGDESKYSNLEETIGDLVVNCNNNVQGASWIKGQEMDLTAKCIMDVAQQMDTKYELTSKNTADMQGLFDGLIGPIVIAVIAVVAIGLVGAMLKKGGRRSIEAISLPTNRFTINFLQ
mgnify:CR=1 FL=1